MRYVLLMAAERPVTGASLALPLLVVLLVAALGALVARPMTRRRHARLVGGTVVDLQRLVGDLRVGDVLPLQRGRRVSGRPAVTRVSLIVGAAALAGKRLVDLVGEEHPVSGLGRHRRPMGALVLLRRPVRTPAGYWQAYLEGVELPVPSGAGERFFSAPAAPADATASPVPTVAPADPQTPCPPGPAGTTDETEAVEAPDATRSEETMNTHATTQWFDTTPDGPQWSRRSAVLERTDSPGDVTDWWHVEPAGTPAEPAGTPAEPAEVCEPPKRSGRRVAVVDVAPPEPVAVEPEPVAVEPEPVAVEPEPVAVEPEPEPVAVEPEPVVVEPEPVVEPQPEPPAELSRAAATAPAVPQQRGHRKPSTQQRQHLRRASSRLETPTDRFEIAQVACAEAVQLVEADSAALVVRSIEGPRVLCQDPQGQGIWGAKTLAALTNLGRPLRKVVEGDPLSGGGQTALLVVPVPSAGSVAGTLIVRRTSGRAFSPAEQDCLERLARMVGASLDTAARRGQLMAQSRVDKVTGLAHRERLVEDLRSALLVVQTHGMPTSLVAAEVTGLAALREDAGRPVADQALAAVAAAVAESMRVGDVGYRFGVDELAVLLPATPSQDAPAVARRLCDAVDALGLRPVGRRLRLRTAVVPVLGVAEEVVHRAIRALAGPDREPSVDA